jgi:hypothetical protein
MEVVMAATLVDELLASDEPAIRYKTMVRVVGTDPASPEVQRTQAQVAASPRALAMLSPRDAEGRLPAHPYAKWYGAHWVLATLADLGYPLGDDSLIPLREQELAWLLGQAHFKTIKTINGRTRRCASQESNAVFSLLKLGLADERVDELVGRLLRWQWSDGGWNCDKQPEAAKSSFMESLIPLRALVLYAQTTGSRAAHDAAEHAAEIFLKRRLFRRAADGTIMRSDFVKLHYPCYWHYDILAGLTVLAEAGRIDDPRCQDALDRLESKRLPDGGFPAEARYYRTTGAVSTGRSPVDWGGTSTRHRNDWVTVEALAVLTAAGRFTPVPAQPVAA